MAPKYDGTIIADDGWMPAIEETPTRCKHGKASCTRCGTVAGRDVIHSARSPNKRDARRARRKAKR
jgi:hypothetical protein